MRFSDVLAFVWLSGVLFKLVYSFSQYFISLYQIKKSIKFSQELSFKLMQIKKQLKVKSNVSIATADYTGSPVLIGILKPVILFPAAEYTDCEKEIIIRHELMHLKRRDVWFKFILHILTCVYWFNPLIYLMQKAAGEDIELACDRDTVKGTDRQFKAEYAQTILRVVSMKNDKLIVSTAFVQSGKILKQRFKNIFNSKILKKGRGIMTAFACVVIVSASFAGCMFDTPAQTVDVGVINQDECIVYSQGNIIANSEDFVYFTLKKDNGTKYGNLFTAKADTDGNITYLCSKEGCAHNDETCGAYHDSETRYVFFNANGESWVMTDDMYSVGFSKVTDEGFVPVISGLGYGQIDNIVWDKNGKIYFIAKVNETLQDVLVCADLQTGQTTQLICFESRFYNFYFASLTEDAKQMVCTVSTEDNNEVIVIDLENITVTTVKKFKQEDTLKVSIYNNSIYTVDTKADCIKVQTVGKSEEEVFIDNLSQKLDVDNLKNVYFYGNIREGYMTLFNGNETKGNAWCTINLDTKEIMPLNLTGSDTSGRENIITILYSVGDKYIAARNYTDTESADIALISKSDYFQSKPNYKDLGNMVIW